MTNISTLPCLNNRSEMASDISQDLSAYVSRDKRQMGADAGSNNNKSGFLSSLFNKRSASFFKQGETTKADDGGAITKRTQISASNQAIATYGNG